MNDQLFIVRQQFTGKLNQVFEEEESFFLVENAPMAGFAGNGKIIERFLAHRLLFR